MLLTNQNTHRNPPYAFYNVQMRCRLCKSFVLICCLLAFAVAATFAQENTLPETPSAQTTAGSSPTTTKADTLQNIAPTSTAEKPSGTHAFWDKENILLFTGVGVFRGLDYASTRNMQARGRREILLADAVVNNSAAFASLEAAGAMTSVGISYIFHRTGHHTLERWMSISHISVTGFGAARNYALKSKHP